ncbi:hypothetical protein MB2181_05330 [Methylophilales bacterium HTCC2181]|uniref:Uncharacterized protein n=1 Tax=Methylophilales bacterium HTCC2181 TaxID=383631 RepID=A0P7G3_9PROT|nr:hypothetical protein MB2181_05330 [Methylophilales bacterium HTCC2181]
MGDENNMALKAFIEAAKKQNTRLPEEVLVKIYKIEERNQYKENVERANVHRELEKLILTALKEV